MILKIQDGTVYGEHYYCVTPYRKSTKVIEWDDISKWCVDAFGPSGTDDRPGAWTPYERWYINNARYWFKDKKDLEWFLLRWQ